MKKVWTSLSAFLISLSMPLQAQTAGDILRATGLRGGLIVHVGCGDGRLTAALRANDSYLIHGLERDAGNVAKARAHIQSLGIYGKVAVEQWSGNQLPYTDNLVNLLVASDLGGIPMAEIMRVLAPRGVAYIREGAKWRKAVKPWPKEIDEWTHYLHDATNNAVANDRVVGPPKRYQWIAGPQWARSHDHLATIGAVVSAKGRILYIVDEGSTAFAAMGPKWRLVARDAFSGVQLWKRPIGPWEGHLRGFRSGPTELARRLVAAGDRVYVTLGYGKPVTALDAATGNTVRIYARTEHALELIHHDGTLFAVAGDRLPDNTDGHAVAEKPDTKWQWWPVFEETPPRKHIVAVRVDTGEVAWQKSDVDTAELMPTTLAAAGSRVFFQSHKEVVALSAASGQVLWRASRPVNRRRPSWSAPTLVVRDGVVLCADRSAVAEMRRIPESEKPVRWVSSSNGGHAPKGQIIAFSAEMGKQLWASDGRECYNAPIDVLVAGGLVWSGDLVKRTEPGITEGLDLRTGEAKRRRPRDQECFKIGMGHHRCYRNKATEKYLVLGRDGIEFIDIATGKGAAHPWVRGACQYGVLPCNGLVYAPPHSCACHIESKLDSFNALAPGSSEGRVASSDRPRIERGPAFSSIQNRKSTIANPNDWPTYRHDALRSGRASCSVSPGLAEAWECKLSAGRITCPSVAHGKVFVASIDTHAVCALDASNGTILWSFSAGGRVDSPPTIHEGTAIFGCADGWIYCLRASDGALAWRFRAAPDERRIVSYSQIESAWPLHGSVLVRNGVVWAVAGRTTHLDGGMRLVRIEAKTGTLIAEAPISAPALPDVLSSDGANVYMRHRRFDANGAEQKPNVPHLYSPAGFLDGSWWHRTYWLVGTMMRSAWGGWPLSGLRTAAGRLLVVDGDDVYGFGRLNQYHRHGAHVGLGKMRYMLYASARIPKVISPKPATPKNASKAKRRRRRPGPAKIEYRWSTPVPMHVRGMLVSGKMLFIAGPPDVLVYPGEENVEIYGVASAEALREQEAALAGAKGGVLWAVSTKDGKKIAEYKTDSPPAWDGLAAANGRLYMSTLDGKVVCMR